jgi:ubiquinone biosynthesis protein
VSILSAPLHIASLLRVGFVLAREGAFGLVDTKQLPPALRSGLKLLRLIERRNVEGPRLVAALTRLGPSYVKFGQFLATRPDIIGIARARELEKLQDRMPAFPQADAEAAVSTALAQRIDDAFLSFGPAVAAASIAQVHRAVVRDGDGLERPVAVKVLRPDIRGRFGRDLSAMRFMARLGERFMPASRRLRPLQVVETLARSVAMEMDLRLEAAALSELGENTKGDVDFRVPKVNWDRTSSDVLVTEWIDGTPLSDLAALDRAGHDRVALARTVIQSFLTQAMRDGFFHADMHQGNLFVDAEGRLVAVDCGIMGRLGPKERRFLAEILHGFITRAYRRVAEVHFEAGYVPMHHSVDDFALAIRAIGEPIQDRKADEISMAKLLTLLFEITGLFDMETRTELVMLQKTMIVVEGVARSLDPKLDMWATASPVVRDWIERNLGPLGIAERAIGGARETGAFLAGVPGLLTRATDLAERLQAAAHRGLTLAPESIAAIGRERARANRPAVAALWIIVALAVYALWR